MRKASLLLTSFALLTLSGCNQSDPTLDGMQSMALVNSCIANSSMNHKKGDSIVFDSAKISTLLPEHEELKQYINAIQTTLKEPKAIQNFEQFLNSSPLFFQSVVLLKADGHQYNCYYVYATNTAGTLKKLPLLYKVQVDKQTSVTKAEYIKPLDQLTYLLGYITKPNGFRFFDVEQHAQISIAQADKNAALNLIPLLKHQENNTSQDQDFKKLNVAEITNNNPHSPYGTSLSTQAAAQIAQSAVASVQFPETVSENPIYLVPVVVRRQYTGQNYTPSDSIIRQMEVFNQNRYVDPEIGINTHRQLVEELKQQVQEESSGHNIFYESMETDTQSKPSTQVEQINE